MNNKKKVLAIYLSPELHPEITGLAKYEHRSLSGQVSYMLTKHLTNMKMTGTLTVNGSDNSGLKFSTVD